MVDAPAELGYNPALDPPRERVRGLFSDSVRFNGRAWRIINRPRNGFGAIHGLATPIGRASDGSELI